LALVSPSVAIQLENSFELWELTSVNFSRRAQFDLPPSAHGVIVYNHAATLVAVGHARGMKVISVSRLKTLVDIKGPQVSAIAYSLDRCQLAWGDLEVAYIR